MDNDDEYSNNIDKSHWIFDPFNNDEELSDEARKRALKSIKNAFSNQDN